MLQPVLLLQPRSASPLIVAENSNSNTSSFHFQYLYMFPRLLTTKTAAHIDLCTHYHLSDVITLPHSTLYLLFHFNITNFIDKICKLMNNFRILKLEMANKNTKLYGNRGDIIDSLPQSPPGIKSPEKIPRFKNVTNLTLTQETLKTQLTTSQLNVCSTR